MQMSKYRISVNVTKNWQVLAAARTPAPVLRWNDVQLKSQAKKQPDIVAWHRVLRDVRVCCISHVVLETKVLVPKRLVDRKWSLGLEKKSLFTTLIRAARCDITQPRPLCFAAVSFVLFSFFYSARDLRGLWADRRETLPHDRKWVQF